VIREFSVSKRLRYWLIGIALMALLIVGFDRGYRYLGVGSLDVTVEFVVTDAENGQPIEGAEILGRGDIDGNGCEREFRLITTEDGRASIVAQNVMYTSETSGLGFTTYRVYPLAVLVGTSRQGFAETAPISLRQFGVPTRTGRGQATLVVPISLRKSQP
jgi:hypothetical protein